MSALLFLGLSFLFGVAIVRLTRLGFNNLERFAFCIVTGTVAVTWIAFLTSALFGYAFIVPAISIATLVIFSFSLRQKKTAKDKLVFSKRQLSIYLLQSFFWSGLFLMLLNSHMLLPKSDGIYSGGNTWGDLALHTSFVEKFSSQTKLNLTSPIYAEENTTYPFLFDFYTSLLYRYGFTLHLSLVVSSFLLLFAFLQLTYFFVVRLLKSHFAATIFPFIFLLNGGLGFIYFFSDWKDSGKKLIDFFFSMPIGYANLFVHHIYWSNLIADYLLPQRSFIMSLAIFVAILHLLLSLYRSKQKQTRTIILVCLLIASLPFFHVHTFLVSLGILLWFFLVHELRSSSQARKLTWILPLVLLGLLTLPQLYWQFSQTFGKGFARVQIGWMSSQDNWILFWIQNMGIEFILTILGTIYLFLQKRQQGFLKLLIIPMLGVFSLINLFVFQPYDYDNTKFLVIAHFGFCLVISLVFLAFYRQKLLKKLILIPLFILLIAAGGLSTIRETYISWQLASKSDLEIAQVIKEKTNPNAVFLTADSHNHPAVMLGGRSIVMGYRGWLWTHGINYTATEKDVMTIYAGTALTPSLLAKYNVSYVYIGAAELNNFQANETYFKSHYPLFYQNESGRIYAVRK